MRNLIKADLDRILQKKSIWILTALIFAKVAYFALFELRGAPEMGAAFAANSIRDLSYLGLIIGFMLVLSVYADDYKSMVLIGVIGHGISREKFILAKFWDTVLILTQVYVAGGLLAGIFGFAGGVRMDSMDLKLFFLQCLMDLLCSIAAVTIAGLFFYITDNTGLGVFAYLVVQMIIPFVLSMSQGMYLMGKFHPERYYLSYLTSDALSDFMMGNILAGLEKMCVFGLVYLAGVLAASMVVFKAKELDF